MKTYVKRQKGDFVVYDGDEPIMLVPSFSEAMGIAGKSGSIFRVR